MTLTDAPTPSRARGADPSGGGGARVWRLYLVGGGQAFRDGRMGVDQILLRRPGGPPAVADPVAYAAGARPASEVVVP